MRNKFLSFLEVAETVVIAIAAVVLIRVFIAQPFLVRGASMEPTFRNGDYLLVDELTYRLRSPARGEVIVFRDPFDADSFYIKRVIGLPGEKVVVKGGRIVVYKGGKKVELHEDYIRSSLAGADEEITLGGNEYFVVGDNRGFSFDSRDWGPLDGDNIVGLARLRLWPFSEAMAITTPVYE